MYNVMDKVICMLCILITYVCIAIYKKQATNIFMPYFMSTSIIITIFIEKSRPFYKIENLNP